jgi:predicted nucleic acid-binding protein
MSSVIVADAGPLIALAKIEQLQLLSALFDQVHIPSYVLHEATDNIALAGAPAVRDFAIAHARVHENLDNDFVQRLRIEIDEGEAQAVALAQSLRCGVLMDDLLGRRVAKRVRVHAIGVAGVLLLAKRKHLIDQVHPSISALTAVNYHLSQSLIAEILRLADE